MRSCCIAQGTLSSHLWWNMMKDSVRKRMYICVWLGHFAVQYKLTGHCKPTIMENIKIIIKINKCVKPPPKKKLFKKFKRIHSLVIVKLRLIKKFLSPLNCLNQKDQEIWKGPDVRV